MVSVLAPVENRGKVKKHIQIHPTSPQAAVMRPFFFGGEHLILHTQLFILNTDDPYKGGQMSLFVATARRICSCGAPLSIYNPGYRCFLCIKEDATNEKKRRERELFPHTPDGFLSAAASVYGIEKIHIPYLPEKHRSEEVIRARYVLIYLLRNKLRMGTKETALFLRLSIPAVVSARICISEKMAVDKLIWEEMKKILEKIS